MYALNRWVARPNLTSPFLHNHFNDLLLIPAALPWVLWVHQRFGWRGADTPPTGWEVTLHLGIWSAICEGLGPHFFHHGIADPGDVMAYAVGGAVSWWWWRRRGSSVPAIP